MEITINLQERPCRQNNETNQNNNYGYKYEWGWKWTPLLNLVVKVEDPNKSQLPAEISRELFN